jgi:hypothetical protein
MDYTMTQPCAACPFRRGTPMRLREGRVLEITDMLLSLRGGEFPCHKTVEYPDDYDAERDGDHMDGKLHCAGALIFAEKNETQTQMMRICHRLGLYDPEKLMGDQAVVDQVFDTVEEAMAHLTSPPSEKPKAKDAATRAEGTAQTVPGGQTLPQPVRGDAKAKRVRRNGTNRPVAGGRRKVNAHANARS